MSQVLDEVLAANRSYAGSFGAKSELALPPARRFAILTCMDARLDPAKYAGLAEGDAHVIRNAGEGSVVEDVQRIRSHPLVPAGIPVYGYVYDVKSGKLVEVPAATDAGRAA